MAMLNSLIVTVIAFYQWREQRMRYFFLIAVTAFVMNAANLLIVMAEDIGSAVFSLKLIHSSFPVVAQFCLLLSFDYIGKRIPLWLHIALSVMSIFFISIIWAYPTSDWFFSEIWYVEADIIQMRFNNGVLYSWHQVYVLILFLIAGVTLLRSYYLTRRRLSFRLTLVASITLPILGQIAYGLKIAPYDWYPLPAAVSVSVLILCTYLMRYLAPEWESLGRYEAVQKMSDAFILVDYDNFLVDMNEQAMNYFPPLQPGHIGTSILDIKGFPEQVLDFETTSLSYSLPPYGDTRNYSLSHSIIYSGKRSIGQSIVVYDNTESVRAINAKQQLELTSNMAVLLDSSPYVGIIFSETYSIIDCNPAALRLFRYRSKQEFITSFMAQFHQSVRQNNSDERYIKLLSERIKSAFDSGRAEFSLKMEIQQEEVPFGVTMKAIRYADSRAVVAYMIPVTESEQYQRMMLDSAPFECDLMDERQQVIDSNLSAAVNRGFANKEDYVNSHWKVIPRKQPDGQDSKQLMGRMIAQAKQDGDVEFDFCFSVVGEDKVLLPRRVSLVWQARRGNDVVIRYAHAPDAHTLQ
jgi:PAS domain-containing protein